MNAFLIEIGKKCKDYRVNVLHMTQKQVAKETGYSIDNISKFELGKTNNLMIFRWYYKRGLRLYE